jgi:hypothetical protein
MSTGPADPDQRVENRIEDLVQREHDLRHHAEGRGLSADEAAELEALQVRLDQLWDLLRRRRATREFGGDPSLDHERDADTVEHYEQ